MRQGKMEKLDLKAKSEQLGVPFSAALEAYVAEAFCYLLSESVFAEFLWLKNPRRMQKERWGEAGGLTLEFAYRTDAAAQRQTSIAPGQPLSLKMGYAMLAYILKKEKTPEIRWRGRAAVQGEDVELFVTGEFAEMTAPLTLRITALKGGNLTPLRREYPLLLWGKGSIPCLEYPVACVLAEKITTILQDMELLQDMEVYDTVHWLLRNEIVDGRSVAERLRAALQEAGISPEPGRLSTLLAYRDYAHMKKRWKKYLRGRKRQEPEWEDVMALIAAFLPRIWDSVCRDKVFLGDWMPELGRFLE